MCKFSHTKRKISPLSNDKKNSIRSIQWFRSSKHINGARSSVNYQICTFCVLFLALKYSELLAYWIDLIDFFSLERWDIYLSFGVWKYAQNLKKLNFMAKSSQNRFCQKWATLSLITHNFGNTGRIDLIFFFSESLDSQLSNGV